MKRDPPARLCGVVALQPLRAAQVLLRSGGAIHCRTVLLRQGNRPQRAQRHRSSGTGIGCSKSAWGKGLTEEANELLVRFLFDELGFQVVWDPQRQYRGDPACREGRVQGCGEDTQRDLQERQAPRQRRPAPRRILRESPRTGKPVGKSLWVGLLRRPPYQ
jgi:hypothetical protein